MIGRWLCWLGWHDWCIDWKSFTKQQINGTWYYHYYRVCDRTDCCALKGELLSP